MNFSVAKIHTIIQAVVKTPQIFVKKGKNKKSPAELQGSFYYLFITVFLLVTDKVRLSLLPRNSPVAIIYAAS